MELTKIQQYKLRQTETMANLKEIIGQTITPVAELMQEYTDSDGQVHNVLAIKTDDNRYFRTEVAAFIEQYRRYLEVFAEDDPRPAITITGKKSRRGNPYLGMEIDENE